MRWRLEGKKTLNIDSIQITPELLVLIAEIDEFKGAWRALGTLAPERLNALRRVATIESISSSTRIEGRKNSKPLSSPKHLWRPSTRKCKLLHLRARRTAPVTVSNDLDRLVGRHLAPRVVESLGTSRIVNIVGPRQAGKSTMVERQVPIADYLTLDDDRLPAPAPGTAFVIYMGDRSLSFGPGKLALPLSVFWSYPPTTR